VFSDFWISLNAYNPVQTLIKIDFIRCMTGNLWFTPARHLTRRQFNTSIGRSPGKAQCSPSFDPLPSIVSFMNRIHLQYTSFLFSESMLFLHKSLIYGLCKISVLPLFQSLRHPHGERSCWSYGLQMANQTAQLEWVFSAVEITVKNSILSQVFARNSSI